MHNNCIGSTKNAIFVWTGLHAIILGRLFCSLLQHFRSINIPECDRQMVSRNWEFSTSARASWYVIEFNTHLFLGTHLIFHSFSQLGTKNDLMRSVKVSEGERMQRKINANQFLECSSKNYENINEVIYEAVRAAAAGLPEPQPETCYDLVRNCFYRSEEDF